MQVQGMLPSPPQLPTPTQRYVCACTVANVCKSKVCYHPHPNPKVCACVCVQLGQGMLPSPPHPPTPNHPPTPTQRYVCVCTVGNVCKSKVCYHPSVQLGMYASPRNVTIPTPPTPPTHPPRPPPPHQPTPINEAQVREKPRRK